MDKNSTYDQIEAYLLHKMSKAERTEFEAELINNLELANQFKEQELEHKMMEVLVEKDLRKNLHQWKSEADATIDTPVEQKNSTAPIPLYRRRSSWAIAASILLLVSAFFLFHQKTDSELPIVEVEDKTKSPSEQPIKEFPQNEEIVTNDAPTTENENLAEEAPKNNPPKIEKSTTPPPTTPEVNYIALANTYSDPIKFETNIRGASDENTYKEALSNLEKGEINLGITKLSELIKTTPNDNIRYNLALAYYQQKKFDQAIPFFQEVITNEYFHIDQAQWFLTLTYLQVGKIEKAKKILLVIKADSDHPRYEKSLALLGKMGKL